VTWQVTLAPDPERVHVALGLKLLVVLLVVNVTEPLGGTAVPGEVSVTVAMQVVGLPCVTGDGRQMTDVLLLRYEIVALWPDRRNPSGGENGVGTVPSRSVRITSVSLKPELPELPGLVRSAANVTLAIVKT